MNHIQPLSSITIVDRPGYFGRNRAEKEAEYTAKYGDTWEECWQIGHLAVNFDGAVLLYDDAYYTHLKQSRLNTAGLFPGQPLADWLCQFTDVYDSDPSNVEAGITHDSTAVPRHIQDVSIRRALLRMGRWFTGTTDKLLQVRGGTGSDGEFLMPGNIPFHLPDLILPAGAGGPTRDWMKPGSVEEWWQRNKIIITRAKPFTPTRPLMAGHKPHPRIPELYHYIQDTYQAYVTTTDSSMIGIRKSGDHTSPVVIGQNHSGHLRIIYKRQLSEPITQYIGMGHYAATNWEHHSEVLSSDNTEARAQIDAAIRATDFDCKSWNHFSINGINEFTASGRNEVTMDDLPK